MLSFAKKIMMNKIYALLFMALALSLLVFWNNSRKKGDEPFCVTYHVSRHTLSSYKILVTYTDSSGLVQETFTSKSWSKKVCLPRDGIASLSAEGIFEIKDFQWYNPESQNPNSKEFEIKPLSIWIEHEKKVVLNAGENHLRVSLLPSEVN